ncbi:hypothetical protein [Ekhidna sp.]|jgi:hypothetical protein|uniref:hypothetical protein n=1 Tax=Ekhidna sp. TaxID=2608089 RepID=UPI0032ED09CA
MSRKPTIKIASLDQVLSYSNEHVLVRFKKTIELLDSDYQIIFEDVLRWLWLSATVWENHLFRVRITSELAIIDQMWHTFLLFTIDYKKFCENYFEVYLHHQPYIKDKVTDSNSVTWEFEKQAQYIIKYLGKETFIRWYYVYPKKYSTEIINQIYQKPYPVT